MSDAEGKDVFAPGQSVGGYRILRRLGKGGMAEVYEAESEKTGSPYALKVFVCDQANAIFLKKRFLAEGRLLVLSSFPPEIPVSPISRENCELMNARILKLCGPAAEPINTSKDGEHAPRAPLNRTTLVP